MLDKMDSSPSPVRPVRRRRSLFLAIGVAGAALLSMFAVLAFRILRSPGDDNPIAMLAFGALMLSAVPTFGLVFFAAKSALERHRLWLVASVLSLLTLAAPAVLAVELLW